MQTVIETPAFLASAKDESIPDEERQEIVTYIAKHPSAGDLMPGTGGARKVRFAGRGKGKSGGYRVITFYAAEDLPVFSSTYTARTHKPTFRKLNAMNCERF